MLELDGDNMSENLTTEITDLVEGYLDKIAVLEAKCEALEALLAAALGMEKMPEIEPIKVC